MVETKTSSFTDSPVGEVASSVSSASAEQPVSWSPVMDEAGKGDHRGPPFWVDQDDVVISGMSGKFPESANVAEFAENLYAGVDMVTDDGRRWTPGYHGLPTRCGKLKELNRFDAGFFNILPKQAKRLDPQMRMLLEVVHEAIVDAGVDPQTIRGSRTGVFVGFSMSETFSTLTRNADEPSGYALTGCTNSMSANRISYSFDFRGPSFPVDTACSSSLVGPRTLL